MSVVVAKRYAKSIFSLAKERGSLDSTFKEITMINEIFNVNKDFINFITNPVVNLDKKKKIIESVFSDNLESFSKSILYFIVENKRANLITQIFEEFNILYRKEKNILQIDLITAKKASESLKNSIIKKFGKGSDVLLREKIDKSILGGILVKSDNKQFDSTVINSINKIKSSFKV